MNELALFSGCGGGILAGKLLGWRTVCAVEIDAYRAERLCNRQNEGFLPPFPIWNGDITAFDGRPWRGIVDVVSGGFPCQDISAANPNARGITGARSGLWKEMFRIICEVGPAYVLVENSPMLAGRGLGVVLGDLAGVGFDARWGVLGADDLGGFHRRKRLFIVANASSARSLPAAHTGVYREEEGGRAWDVESERFSESPCNELGHANRAGLQGHAGDGDRDRGPNQAGHIAASGIRVLANSSCEQRRAEHEQQISEGRGPREQSGRRGDDVADGAGVRQSPARDAEIHNKKNSRGQAIRPGCDHALRDALWEDFQFIECTDGKLRAIKPGICGMAHGMANRMDRTSAIGDGQVPIVVAAAFQILTHPPHD